jgi:hypothetical protein
MEKSEVWEKKHPRLRPAAHTRSGACLGICVALVIALLGCLLSCNAQGYNWKRAIAPAALSFTAGAAWGTNQVLEHRNAAFFRVFPEANVRFWGPDSWRNKYVGFNPENGRNKTPIWITDGKHLTASANQVLIFGAGLCIGIGKKRKWWHYAADIGVSFVAYSAGNYVTYNLIFR